MKRAKKSSTAQAVGRSGPTGCSPCPFCGTDFPPTLFKGRKGRTRSWFVFCNMCLAEGPPHADVNDALKAWNGRANVKGDWR